MNLVKSKVVALVLMLTLVLPTLLSGVVSVNAAVTGAPTDPTLTILKLEQEPTKEIEKPDGELGDQEPPEDEGDLLKSARALADNGEPGNGLSDQTAEGKPLEGVTFEIKKTHHYNIDTDTWSAVSGDDAVVLKKVTGKDGKVVFTKEDGLELGRYEVRETAGPEHVILNNKVFTVDVPMTSKDGKDLNYDVHIYPKNETVRGDVELTKKNEEGKLSPGIIFNLFNADGTKAKDSNGNEFPDLITGTDGKVAITGLAAGKYFLREIKTLPGLAINASKLEFEVKKDTNGQKVVVEWKEEDKYLSAEGKEAELINYKKPEIEKDIEGDNHFDVDREAEFNYNLTIKTPNDVDKYTELGVTDTLDNRLEYTGKWEVQGTTKDNIDFKQDGQTLVWSVKDLSKLTPGKDVKVTFSAKLKKDAVLKPEEMATGIPNTAKLDFDNNKGSYTKPKDPNDPNVPPTTPEEPPVTPPVTVRPKDGGIKVLKVDKADNTKFLANAEFKLTTDEEGQNVVDTTGTSILVNGQKDFGKIEDVATNAKGEISITGLTPGTYYLHETKAPTYEAEKGVEKPYRLLTKPVKVVVQDKIDDKEVKVENSKSGWDLPTTGGMGTLLFTIAGLSFMFMAFVLIFKRDKKAA